jgi:hypothetical protein
MLARAVYLQGSGKGQLSYEINDEPTVVGTDCTVDGLEDDASQVLQLDFAFTDAANGPMAVSVSLQGFDPATTMYDDSAALDVLVSMLAGRSWTSGAGSSVLLNVFTSPTEGGCRYRGTFDAGNLAPLGAGDALAIKFASYDVTLEPQEQ